MSTRKSATKAQSRFASVPGPRIQRSVFDRSHGYKTTMDVNGLYPIFIDEVLPGDTFTMKSTLFGRLATPLHPVMDNLTLETFTFFVPYRILWENWERFNGAQDNPGDSTDYVIPKMDNPTGGYPTGSLADYFGLPTLVEFYNFDAENDLRPSALPFRAMQAIWNEWFRDQNLQNSSKHPINDGPDDPAPTLNVFKRNKRHDYFTSALPWPQKGTEVTLGLGQQAPLVGLAGVDVNPNATDYKIRVNVEGQGSTLTPLHASATSGIVDAGSPAAQGDINWAAGNQIGGLGANLMMGAEGWDAPYADLSAATAVTINQLREASRVQALYERDARGGTRYTEILRSHFGVTPEDQRLQRPELVHVGRQPINVNPVQQTTQQTDTGQTPLGNLAAFMTVSGQSGWTKSFTEHGVVMTLANVRADLNYQQGIHKMWTRSTRFDFYWPDFQNLGEQLITNQEIYVQGSMMDNGVWGYQERYAEYRYKPSQVTGLMRSNATGGSLDTWHYSQDFDALPVLNSTFIEEDVPIDRTVAVPSEPDVLLDCFHQLRCARPMPTYSVPGIKRF